MTMLYKKYRRVLQTTLLVVLAVLYLYYACQLFIFKRASVCTSLLLFLGLAGLGHIVLKLMAQRLGWPARTAVNVQLFLGTLILCTTCADLALRYGFPRYASYVEKNGSSFYASAYVTPIALQIRAKSMGTPGRLHLLPKNLAFIRHSPEFSHAFHINSQGIRDREHPKQKPAGERRIIALGDSFTEGIGASFEETWLQQLSALLSAQGDTQLRVINGGVAGSDPFYAYMLLHDRLLDYQPDVVLVAINSSDLEDYLVRGGMERFQADGTARYRQGPAWEWLYASSYLVRHVVHDVLGYDWLLMHPIARAALTRQASLDMYAVCQAFAELGQQHGFTLLFIFHPMQNEVLEKRLQLADLMRKLKHEAQLQTLDLLEYYTTIVGIEPQNLAEYYWPLDQHHTPKGYRAFAEGVASHLLQHGWLPGQLGTSASMGASTW